MWSRSWALSDGQAPTKFNANGPTTIGDPQATGIMTRWGFGNGLNERKDAVRCKASVWHPDSIPRIGEDGGACGRLAYVSGGGRSCRGQPMTFLVQPGHACLSAFSQGADGHWNFEKYAWLMPSYYTVGENFVPTDDANGVVKNLAANVDYTYQLPLGVNHGLHSWVDVRLAMHLFRTIYIARGAAQLDRLAGILISALAANPHFLEAWVSVASFASLPSLTNPNPNPNPSP